MAGATRKAAKIHVKYGCSPCGICVNSYYLSSNWKIVCLVQNQRAADMAGCRFGRRRYQALTFFGLGVWSMMA